MTQTSHSDQAENDVRKHEKQSIVNNEGKIQRILSAKTRQIIENAMSVTRTRSGYTGRKPDTQNLWHV